MPPLLRAALAAFLLVGAIRSAQAQAPALTLSQPVQGTVARPTLHIKANCVPSAGHCQLAVTVINGTTKFPAGTYADSVDTAVDVSTFEGSTNMELEVIGTDQNGLQSTQVLNFFVETSPFLTPVFVANNPIIDFLGNNVLVDNLLNMAFQGARKTFAGVGKPMLADLGAGLYYLRVYDATGRSVIGKAILKTN